MRIICSALAHHPPRCREKLPGRTEAVSPAISILTFPSFQQHRVGYDVLQLHVDAVRADGGSGRRGSRSLAGGFDRTLPPLESKQPPSPYDQRPAEELEAEDCVPASAHSCPATARLLLTSSSSSVSSSPASVRPVHRQSEETYIRFKSVI